MPEIGVMFDQGRIQGKVFPEHFPHNHAKNSPFRESGKKLLPITPPRKTFPDSLNGQNAPIFRMDMRNSLRENLSLTFPEFPESGRR
jgi:hypothetical protein